MNGFQRVTLLYVVSSLNADHNNNLITNHVQQTLTKNTVYFLTEVSKGVCSVLFYKRPHTVQVGWSATPFIVFRGLPG